MMKEPRQTPAAKGERRMPELVRLALEALKILETEGRKIEGLNKLLPTFAMKLAQSGGAVTMETLLAHARAGELNLKRTIPEQKPRSYAEIVARFSKLAVKDEFDNPCYSDFAAPIYRAAKNGDLAALKRMVKRGVSLRKYKMQGGWDYSSCVTLRLAVENGHLEVLKYLVEKQKLDDGSADWMVLQSACQSGQLAIVKYLVEERRFNVQDGGEYALGHAAASGHLPVVKYLVEEQGADGHAGGEWALGEAASNGHLDMVKYFVEERQADMHAWGGGALIGAYMDDHMNVAKYLVEQGARLSYLDSRSRKYLKKYIQACPLWQKAAAMDPPASLYGEDPVYFRAEAYAAACDILKLEGYKDAEGQQMAFYASGLFGTEERVLQYLEKWGKAGKQPLHDVVYDIRLPKEKTPEMDLKAWADAVLKCGPSMAALVKFADRLPVPEKSADGKTWSMMKTREKVAQLAYGQASKNPALAALCLEHAVDEEDFNEALKLSKKIPKIKNIPEITIDGQKFDMEGGKFYRLPANDIRGLFLGELTDCCQSIGGAGAECAEHGFTSKNGGFYVVENAKGKVVAQTWAWRGKEGELVFDSLETLGASVTPGQWEKILQAVGQELTAKKTDVARLTVGLGGKTPRSLKESFAAAARPAEPLDYNGYRDSRAQIRVWGKNSP